MCTSVAEAEDLLEIACGRRLKIGVNHNFLNSAAYERLREIVRLRAKSDHSTTLHSITSSNFPRLRFGPFDSWMLRAPGNVILEVGPHLVSAMLDLVGEPEHLFVSADREVTAARRSTGFSALAH